MKQYLELLKEVRENGSSKEPSRDNMPPTLSIFGPQMVFDLRDGFPMITTKEVSLKNIVVELLWFLRKDANISYMVNKGVNIWNEDAYNYFQKLFPDSKATMEEFIERVKGGYHRKGTAYRYGDTGYQYPKVWRNITLSEYEPINGGIIDKEVDQITRVIKNLREQPFSRRHVVSAVDVANDTELALYWCHSLFQFNCRVIDTKSRIISFLDYEDNSNRLPVSLWRFRSGVIKRTQLESIVKGEMILLPGENCHIFELIDEFFDYINRPKFYLDCKLYQRSADIILGVPYNIASYALLTTIIAKLTNMVPANFIHSFGDLHLYGNHYETADIQLSRQPMKLPELVISHEFKRLMNGSTSDDEVLMNLEPSMFSLTNYNSHSKLGAKLNTGKKDPNDIKVKEAELVSNGIESREGKDIHLMDITEANGEQPTE